MTPVEIALRQAERDLASAERRVILHQQAIAATMRGSPAREEADRELSLLLDACAVARSAFEMRLHEALRAGVTVRLKAPKR